jgi:hypothetical protein
MDNTFIPKAIETVKEAIAADNGQDYEAVSSCFDEQTDSVCSDFV